MRRVEQNHRTTTEMMNVSSPRMHKTYSKWIAWPFANTYFQSSLRINYIRSFPFSLCLNRSLFVWNSIFFKSLFVMARAQRNITFWFHHKQSKCGNLIFLWVTKYNKIAICESVCTWASLCFHIIFNAMNGQI